MNNKYITTIFIVTMLIFMSGIAMATVWTDQLDYSPGSVVTISGDNSDGAGYSEGETVNVAVNGPYNYDQSCSGTADSSGTWSCQITLSSDYTAEGSYTYTAVGQASGVTQSGTFTDAPPISTTLTKPVLIFFVNANTVKIFGPLTVGSGPLNGHTIRLQVSFNGGTFVSTGLTTTTDLSGSYSFIYTPASGGTYVFRTQINPSDAGNAGYAQASSPSSDSVTVISNVPPIISADNPSETVNEGSTATNTGTYSDTNSGDNVGITASVGTISKTGTNSGTWSWSYPSTDGPDQSQTVTITANDGNGGITTTTFSLTVNNVAPTIALSGATNVNEGSPYTLNLDSISDPGTDIVSAYKIDWGDGGTDTFSGSPVGLSKVHTYLDGPNSYVIKVDLTDEDGTFASAGSKTVSVNNVAPIITAPSDQSAIQNVPASFNLGSFSDPGVNDNPWAVDIDWDDGSVHTILNNVGQGTIPAQSHTYSSISIGTYTVTVKVTDKDGDYSSNTFKVDVNYNFKGFYQPVDNPTPSNIVWNVVQSGSGIPTKFGLTGYQGLDIMYSDNLGNYPKSIKVDYTGGNLDDIEQTVTAGSSSLTYDSSTDQYIYVWKTDKAWKGTYRQLIVKLKDGTEHVAYFKFK